MDLLSDFKAAALSVTNLYKTAAKSQEVARKAGYQDALDDLLAFLDKENLGLMDGEGWRVRQWAHERVEGEGAVLRQSSGTATTMTDEEDNNSTVTKEEDAQDERSSSPEVQRRPHPLATTSSDLTEDESLSQHRRVVSEPPQALAQHQATLPQQSEFTFQSTHAYPTNHDRDAGMDMDGTNSPQHDLNNSSTPSSTETVRIISRPARNSRHGNSNKRNDNRMPTLNFNLGSGAGNKRKMPYSDFFDISGLNEGGDRKDGNGNGRGGKRGRHV